MFLRNFNIYSVGTSFHILVSFYLRRATELNERRARSSRQINFTKSSSIHLEGDNFTGNLFRPEGSFGGKIYLTILFQSFRQNEINEWFIAFYRILFEFGFANKMNDSAQLVAKKFISSAVFS